MKRSTIARTLALSTVAVLTLSLAPKANAAGKACSDTSLKGTFADRDTGFLTAPPEVAGPFAGVNLDTFDGHGVLTGNGMVSLNGSVVPGTFEGTYTVNADCTGTYTVQNSLGLTVHAFFVIADGGNELQIIITDPGTVITCVARRQLPTGDSDQGYTSSAAAAGSLRLIHFEYASQRGQVAVRSGKRAGPRVSEIRYARSNQ